MSRFLALVALLGSGVAGEAPGGERPEALEARMAELVNRDRAERQLPPLAYDAEAAAVARAHSLDMKANRFFAHESKRTGRVADRVAKAGIPNRGVAENLARAATVEDCEKTLMASPKHRETLLRTDLTHIGIGLVRNGEGQLLCTQVFIQAPPVYDVAKVRQEIVEGINKARLEKGLRRLLADDVLSGQALAHSERAAKKGEADYPWLREQLTGKDTRWSMHEAGCFLTDDVSRVVLSEMALGAQHDHFGVGVVQAPARSKEAGALWVTLICAQKK